MYCTECKQNLQKVVVENAWTSAQTWNSRNETAKLRGSWTNFEFNVSNGCYSKIKQAAHLLYKNICITAVSLRKLNKTDPAQAKKKCRQPDKLIAYKIKSNFLKRVQILGDDWSVEFAGRLK